jgi:hypothetical protein
MDKQHFVGNLIYLRILGEGSLKILTKLINTIYEPGEWPYDFTEITMIALKKKTQATKCSDASGSRSEIPVKF